MMKTYLTDVSRGAIFSFTGMDPVSFGVCAKPCDFS
jgi:hypothetical protein